MTHISLLLLFGQMYFFKPLFTYDFHLFFLALQSDVFPQTFIYI